MAEWGNGQNTLAPQPMDSNGQKLKVRNTPGGSYTPSNYMLDVEDSSTNAQAMKVDGNIELERGEDHVATIEPSID